MVFILSKLYQSMPESIKNRRQVIELVQKFNNNNKFKEIESHYQMLDLIFNSCDIKANGMMRQIQLLSLELLRLFDKICEKHNIEYWIDYGTLLGAIRHRGFVPWDDDVDISMTRTNYEKFIKIFPEEINKIEEIKDKIIISKLTKPHENYPNNCNEQDILNNGTFILFFQCAYKKPFVHFDVFPKDYILDEGLTPDRNEKQTQLQVELREKIEDNTWSFDEGLKTQQEKMKFTKNETKNLSDAIDGLHNNIHNRIYPTEYIFPLKKATFEGYEFSCPNDHESYLPLIYGPDYMHIPRIALDHNTTGFIKSQYDNDEKTIKKEFEEAITMLKNINEKYE